MGNANGKFVVSIGLFEDAEMNQSIMQGSDIPVGDETYVRIHLNGPPDVKLVVKSCMATPDDNPQNPVNWYLIKDS